MSRVYKRDVKGTTKRKKDSFPRYQLEVDDQLVEVEADALALPSFSPNGEHYSFVFLRHEKFGIGLNGKTLPVSENLILSAMPDSTGARVVWIEHRDGDLAKKYWLNRNVQNSIYQGKSHLCSGYVVDGDEGLILDELEFSDPYDKIHRYTFSPNEERVVFLAEVEKKYYVVCGAQQIGPFDGVDRIEWINEDQIGVGTREENEYWWRTMTVDD